MIEHSKNELKNHGYSVEEKIIITGFSASATFANRFTEIHLEHILATVVGGLNGLLILPIYKYKDEELIYPIGTSDFMKLFEISFNKDLFV